MKDSKPAVKCPRCKGKGTVTLSTALAVVLDVLRRDSPLTTMGVLTALGPRVGLSFTALSNRLEDLRKLGLVTRKKGGRVWYYSIKI